MYHRGGYIAQFFRNAPKSLLSSMKSLLLNVDYYIGQLRNVVQPLPFEDLFFALGNLTDKPFKTSIQVITTITIILVDNIFFKVITVFF